MTDHRPEVSMRGDATHASEPGLTRRADQTLTEQLAARFSERIRQRLLAPGARLPSVRECAQRHQVSPSTVVAAYDQLQALGLVEARQQRGFYVRAAATPGPRGRHVSAPNAAPRTPLPVSATTLIRGMFQPPGGRPMPGLGTLPADWLDPALLANRPATCVCGRRWRCGWATWASMPLRSRTSPPSARLRLSTW